MKALFDIINEAVVDGELPEDFYLPETKVNDTISWADGAMDGIGIYHMGTSPVGELQLLLIGNAMDAAGEGDFEKAESCLRQAVSGEHGNGYALCIMDDMQRYIIKHADKLSPQNVFQFAMHQILTSDNKECVKLGLSILELIKSDISDTIKSHIMTVGLSDEFALYAIYAISKWDDANEHIFQLAKKVHGWGRVHAVAALQPTTNDIKDWLIKEGVHNRVMPAYSAYECWSKGDAEDRLTGDLNPEEYAGIRDIIEGLLDEGPVVGISRIEDAPKHMKTFLQHSKGRILMIEDYSAIYQLRTHYDDLCENRDDETEEESSNYECFREIVQLCDELLKTKECKTATFEAVKQGREIALAQFLDLDCKPELIKLLQQDFNGNGHLCSILMKDPDYVEAVVEAVKANIPIKDVFALEHVVGGLRAYPNIGVDVISHALDRKHVRTKSKAVRSLIYWTKLSGKSLKDIAPELYQKVKTIEESVEDETLAEMIKQLLSENSQS